MKRKTKKTTNQRNQKERSEKKELLLQRINCVNSKTNSPVITILQDCDDMRSR